MSGWNINCEKFGRIKVRWDVEQDHVTITQDSLEEGWTEEINIHLDQIDEFCRAVQTQALGVNRSK